MKKIYSPKIEVLWSFWILKRNLLLHLLIQQIEVHEKSSCRTGQDADISEGRHRKQFEELCEEYNGMIFSCKDSGDLGRRLLYTCHYGY